MKLVRENLTKLFISILLNIVLIVSIFFLVKVKDSETSQIVNDYTIVVDSLQRENSILLVNIDKLNKEVDSLEQIKAKISIKYADDVKIINNADAAAHAQWLSTTISELRSNKKQR